MDDTVKIVRYSVFGIMLAWFLGAGWAFFIPLIPDSVETEQSAMQFKERLKVCEGSFKERYECKSALKRQRNSDGFIPLATAIGIILTPLLILFVGLGHWIKSFERNRLTGLKGTTVQKRQEIREEDDKRREEDHKIQQEQVQERNTESKRRKEMSRADENARAESKPDPVHVLLILKDEDENAELTNKLGKMGYHVTSTNTVEDGLIGIKKLRYEVVVLGILIEGLGGIEGIKNIREHRNDIKIIATSAGTDGIGAEDVLKAAEVIGAYATLARPYKAKDLGRLILKLAPKKSAE